MTQRLPQGSDDAHIVGTNAWAAAGGQPLSFGQKITQLLGANRAYLEELPGELRWVLASRGLAPHRKVARIGIDALPDTPAVELAVNELERYAEGETELLNHSYRTFGFADLLYRQSGAAMPMDREVLAVVTLLHDVGVYPKAVAEVDAGEFTVRAAHVARRIGQRAGWPQVRIDLAAQAITINACGRVSTHWGAEAHFARLAPLVDAVGQCWKVHPDDALQIFTERPADAIGPAIVRIVGDEAARQPGGRFALFKPLFPVLVHNCSARWGKRVRAAVE